MPERKNSLLIRSTTTTKPDPQPLLQQPVAGTFIKIGSGYPMAQVAFMYGKLVAVTQWQGICVFIYISYVYLMYFDTLSCIELH